MTTQSSPRTSSCCLCDGQSFEVLSELDRKHKPLTTVVCQTCGLVSHEQIPSDEALAHYYQSQYRQDYHGEFVPSAYRVVREWKRGKQLLDLLHPYVAASDDLLEIGSGIGCTVKNFELAGLRARGIEPGEGFCRFSNEKLQASIENVELADLPATPQADFVLLVHVLEHFNDPKRALEQIRALLRPSGKLYVEVPNYGAPHALPGKLFHYAHIYNYTVKTLTMLGEAAGYSVNQVLSSERDKNLRILFERTDDVGWTLDKSSYDYSLAAMRRYNAFTYHARWSYISQRVRTLFSRLVERRTAQKGLEHILTLCQDHATDRELKRVA